MNLIYQIIFYLSSHWASGSSSFYLFHSQQLAASKAEAFTRQRQQEAAAKGSENPTIKLDFSNFKCHMMTWVHAQEGVEVVAVPAVQRAKIQKTSGILGK